MTLTLLNILYALVALGMIGLILLQRGAGAQAGSGFGSGASATVFGARGASNFLTRTTAILGALFFVLSLGMGMYIARQSQTKTGEDMGVMTGTETPAVIDTTVPAAGVDVPVAPAPDASVAPTEVPADVPAAAAPATDVPPPSDAKQPAAAEKPTAPATDNPGKG